MKKEIILASNSPRRRELLARLCPTFQVMPADIDESLCLDVSLADEVLRLAQSKGNDVKLRTDGPRIIISADTVVTFDDQPLGKPKDSDDARRMLQLLSGRKHEVLTAASVLTDDGFLESVLSRTEVTFYTLSEDEIEAYIQTGEPLDKAGAYGIQGRGALLVRGIEGDFYSVMGLPIAHLSRMLRACGVVGI